MPSLRSALPPSAPCPTALRVFRAVGGRLLPGVPIQLEGRLVKKDLSLNWKRARHRSWNAYWAVLQHPYLLLFKDRGSTIRSTRDVAAKHVLELTAASFADVASDYKKRRHVFRLMPVPGTEMLFEARSDDDMDAWLHALEQCVHKVCAQKRRRERWKHRTLTGGSNRALIGWEHRTLTGL